MADDRRWKLEVVKRDEERVRRSESPAVEADILRQAEDGKIQPLGVWREEYQGCSHPRSTSE